MLVNLETLLHRCMTQRTVQTTLHVFFKRICVLFKTDVSLRYTQNVFYFMSGADPENFGGGWLMIQDLFNFIVSKY